MIEFRRICAFVFCIGGFVFIPVLTAAAVQKLLRTVAALNARLRGQIAPSCTPAAVEPAYLLAPGQMVVEGVVADPRSAAGEAAVMVGIVVDEA